MNAHRLCHVRVAASSTTTEYKQQIHDQLHGTATLPTGPVALEVSFAVGPSRNWTNLWKPTIDAVACFSAGRRRTTRGIPKTDASST
jgi:hypothetical protein